MKSLTSLKEALQSMAEDHKGRPSPSLDRLIAYQRGSLPDSQRDEVQDYISYNPEAAQFLLHLSHSADMEELTGEMVASDKEAFLRRLEQLDQDEDSPAAPPSPASANERQSLLQLKQGWPTHLQTAYAMAAVFFFLAVALFLWPHSSPAPDLGVAQHTIDTTSRFRGGTIGQDEVVRIHAHRRLELTVVLQDVEDGQLSHLVVGPRGISSSEASRMSEKDSSLVAAKQGSDGSVVFTLDEALSLGEYSMFIYLIEEVVNTDAAPDSNELEKYRTLRREFVSSHLLEVVPASGQ